MIDCVDLQIIEKVFRNRGFTFGDLRVNLHYDVMLSSQKLFFAFWGVT